MVVQIYTFDTSTSRTGVRLEEDGMAVKEANGGWVSLRSTQPLTPSNPHWAIKIVDHGESPDASGLMVGLLPKLSPGSAQQMGTKYISELGGWCLSRAGEYYGAWKCERVSFGTGSVVEME
eukprot:PhF_6_TR10189/c0_g1_i1/m.15801